MPPLDPYTCLELPEGASPREVEDAYRLRRLQTDPERVAGMDARIQQVTRQARAEVELAYRMLTTPGKLEAADQALLVRLESAPAAPPPEGPETKSYFRAVMYSLMIPGSGSWYGGGRTRGLVAVGLVALAMVALMLQVRADMAAATGSYVQRLQALGDSLASLRGAFYGVLFLATADACVAVWAHNDRVRGRLQAPAAPASPALSAGSSSAE